jgi:hypothetical protein
MIPRGTFLGGGRGGDESVVEVASRMKVMKQCSTINFGPTCFHLSLRVCIALYLIIIIKRDNAIHTLNCSTLMVPDQLQRLCIVG